ncbi:hypothetical protein GCM10010329_59210 [Streptomyces spiroverticillatus]|uniref:Uncharacterized protein n=1 Tax=Streptomyces finlayi TaxID=67296 RepID=A0A918X495_9ACTN|nr:hypothetical protein GCM10010329_59210 [Streptomyces spiroverticillatus]GHD09006.1 hypothetical protein GCM10010334_62870 [Streptomyces finlayi]
MRGGRANSGWVDSDWASGGLLVPGGPGLHVAGAVRRARVPLGRARPVSGVRAGGGVRVGPDRAGRPLARPFRPRGAAPPPKGAGER